MIASHIHISSLVTGVLTATLCLQALAPKLVLQSFYGKEVDDEFSLFLARSSGVPIATMGLLLIWASFFEPMQTPVMVSAIIGKGFFLLVILANWQITGLSLIHI